MKRTAFTYFVARSAKTSGRDFGPRKRNGAATNSPKRDTIHFPKNTAELRFRFFVVFLLAITPLSYRLGTPKSKIIVLRAISGTLLAPILTQSIICHLIARIYVQLAPLAAHEGMQNGGGECHDLSTHQLVSHLLPRKMPSLHHNGKIFSFSPNPKRY